MKLLLAFIFSLSFNVQTQDYSFNAYFRGNLQYDDIEFPNKAKYLVLNLLEIGKTIWGILEILDV